MMLSSKSSPASGVPINAWTWLWHHPSDGFLPILFTLATAAPFIICFQNPGIAELFGRLMTPSLASGILVFVLTSLHFVCVRLCVFHHVQAVIQSHDLPERISRYATPMTRTLQAPSEDVFKASNATKALIIAGSLLTTLGGTLLGHPLLWLLSTTGFVIAVNTWSAIDCHTADLPKATYPQTRPSAGWRAITPPVPIHQPRHVHLADHSPHPARRPLASGDA